MKRGKNGAFKNPFKAVRTMGKLKSHLTRCAVRRTIFSIVVALLLCVGDYLLANAPFAVGGGASWMFFLENTICRVLSPKENLDSVIFVNVSYDRSLADITLYGMPHGRKAITDRETLLNLLRELRAADNYRYVFLDVRFENGIRTETDSMLFATVAGMRDIVIPIHDREGFVLASPVLEPKAALSDYTITKSNTSFSKYQYLQNGGESVPLRIYHDLNGRTIVRKGLVFKDGTLCRNALFIRMENDMGMKRDLDQRVRYYDMGPELLQFFSDGALSSLTEGKFVFIGDFENDMHSTYNGNQPGTYLTYLALWELLDGKHLISPWSVLFKLLFYALLAFWILSGFRLLDIFRNQLVRFLMSFVGYSFVLTSVSVVFFVLSSSTLGIFLPSAVFSVMNQFVNYKNYA